MSWGMESSVSDRLQMEICYLYIVQVVRCTPILCDDELLDISSLNGAVEEEYSKRLGNRSVKVVVDSQCSTDLESARPRKGKEGIIKPRDVPRIRGHAGVRWSPFPKGREHTRGRNRGEGRANRQMGGGNGLRF